METNKKNKNESIINMEKPEITVEKLLHMMPLLTAVVSVCSIVATVIFKMGSYMYFRGCFDCWNIPVELIETDYKSIIYSLLLVMGITVPFLIVSDIFVFFWRHEWKKRKWCHIAGLILLFFIVSCGFILHIFSLKTSLSEMIVYIKHFPVVSLLSFFIILLILGVLVYLSGNTLEMFLGEEVSGKKTEKKSWIEEKCRIIFENKRVGIMIAFVILILGVWYYARVIHDAGMKNVSMKESVDIVHIDQMTYVLVNQYEDKWILKRCFLEQNELTVDRNHYMIRDISEKDIERFTLKGKKLGECIKTRDEYIFGN